MIDAINLRLRAMEMAVTVCGAGSLSAGVVTTTVAEDIHAWLIKDTPPASVPSQGRQLVGCLAANLGEAAYRGHLKCLNEINGTPDAAHSPFQELSENEKQAWEASADEVSLALLTGYQSFSVIPITEEDEEITEQIDNGNNDT